MILLQMNLLPMIKKNLKVFIMIILIGSLGASLYIAFSCSYMTLRKSVDKYVEDYNYPDCIITTSLTDKDYSKNLCSIKGVKEVNTRIVLDKNIKKTGGHYVTARFISYKDTDFTRHYVIEENAKKTDNNKYIYIDVEYRFAKNNDYRLGDVFTIDGIDKRVCIKRIISSPECLEVARNRFVWFDNTDFGQVFIEEDDARSVFGIQKSYNQILIESSDSYDNEVILKKAEKIITDSTINSFTYENSIVKQGMDDKIDTLNTVSRIVPPLFLLFTLIFIYLFLRQILKQNWNNISILRSLGFGRNSIGLLYGAYCIICSLISVIIGIVIGIFLRNLICNIYKDILALPYMEYIMNASAVIAALLLLILVGQLATLIIIFSNIKRSLKEVPAKRYKKSFVLNISLPLTVKLAIGKILRNKKRFLLTTFCIIVSGFLMFISFAFYYSKEYIIGNTFNERFNYDCQIYYDSLHTDMYNTIRNSKGITGCEEIIYYSTVIENGSKNEKVLINGINPNSRLIHITDKSNNAVSIQKSGIVLCSYVANKLGVKRGDNVKINGKRVNVSDISLQAANYIQYCSLQQAYEFQDKGSVCSSFLCTYNRNFERNDFYDNVDTEGFVNITYLSTQRAESDNVLETMDITVKIIVVFSLLMGISVIYNIALINYTERKKDYHILNSLGMSGNGIWFGILLEAFIQIIISIIIILPAGRLFSVWYLKQISTTTMQYIFADNLIISIITSMVIIAFVIGGNMMARFKLSRKRKIYQMKEEIRL